MTLDDLRNADPSAAAQKAVKGRPLTAAEEMALRAAMAARAAAMTDNT